MSTLFAQVNALKDDVYTDSFFMSFVCVGSFCTIPACLLTILFLYPCLPKCFESGLVPSIAVASLAMMTWMLWTTVMTTNHRDAVEDLLAQLTSSMDTLISSSLSDSIELVKTAHNTWKFTGTVADPALVTIFTWDFRFGNFEPRHNISLGHRAHGKLPHKLQADQPSLRHTCRPGTKPQWHSKRSSCVETRFLRLRH